MDIFNCPCPLFSSYLYILFLPPKPASFYKKVTQHFSKFKTLFSEKKTLKYFFSNHFYCAFQAHTVFQKVSSYILTRFYGQGHTQPSSPMSSALADSSFNSTLQIYWQLLKIFTAPLPFPLGFWACNLPTHSPDHLSKPFPLSPFYFALIWCFHFLKERMPATFANEIDL